MDESVRHAMAKWPDVPALHGWLSLDETGRWLLKGEPITHPGLVAFINRNYDGDEAGRWFFQNGPQRGYVRLEYTPWVLHVDSAGALRAHTGQQVESVSGCWIDEQGNMLLLTEIGVGLVDSDALPLVADWLRDARDGPIDAEDAGQALAAVQQGQAGELRLEYTDACVPVEFIHRSEVPRRFGFVADPASTQD